MKRRFIIFEGISGSGKTTLEDLYRQSNNYHDYTMHRFTASKYVYAKYYNREISLEALHKDEINILRSFDTRVILCVCNPIIAQERKVELHDENVEKDLDKCQELFREYIHHYSRLNNYLVLNTDTEGKFQCLDKINKFMKLSRC